MTSDSVTVVVFETVYDAKELVVEYGRDARRYGATVVSYAAARTPGHLRPQYAAVLDAVAKGTTDTLHASASSSSSAAKPADARSRASDASQNSRPQPGAPPPRQHRRPLPSRSRPRPRTTAA